jgi:putative thioredoxin
MHAFDVSEADFDAKVVAASHRQPVVIDFWAPWCAPCKVLKPVLEKLAEEFGGKFLLAKVNSDENPELAARYGVRGIPAVKAVAGGKVVNEFTGALPEGAVREWLGKIIPSPAEEMRTLARQRMTEGDLDGALAQLAEASEADPDNEWVRVDAAEILLLQDNAVDARALLESLKDIDVVKDNRVAQLLAQARLAQAGTDSGSEKALSRAIEINENDLEARLRLGKLLVASNRLEEGMDQLLEIVKRDRNFRDDIGRKTLLDVFNLLGGQGPLVTEYRRRLSSLLSS